MSAFHLEILLPDKQLFSGEIVSLNVPAADGRLGILARHAPLFTLLGKGEVRAKGRDQADLAWRINAGFLKVEKGRAQILLG